ncbi:MAG: LysM peptidoglycan-binding domain-containing protein [Devosia sp.]|nr:LysM peptidoglycan-binding domain-containing protein [Devosia sp.]
MRRQIVDAGLLPPSEPAPVAEPRAVPAAPEPEPPAEAIPAAPDEPKVAAAVPPPVLTLLRVEPDGSAVIAGSGSPGVPVEVFANGEILGTATPEPGGDWVVVTDARLPPGGVEIKVSASGSDQLSEQSFVVLVDPDRAAEPLVGASKPGEASAVLQGLPRTAAQPAAEPATEPGLPVAAVEPAPEVPAEETAVPAAPAPVEEPKAPVVATEPDAADPEPAGTAPTVILPLSIDAIEIDGTANFFAGGGAEGATVWLYVDDKYVADAKVAEGRWLVEARDVLTQASQRVRVDMLKPGTAEVVARAEVNLVIDLPGGEVEPEPEPVELAQPEPELRLEEPAVIAEPFDRALDPAADAVAATRPARNLGTAPDAAPAAGTRRDLATTADTAPAARPDRDLAAVGKPMPQPAAAPGVEDTAREVAHSEDRMTEIEVAAVPDAAVTGPTPLLLPPTESTVMPEPDAVAAAVAERDGPVADLPEPAAPVEPVVPVEPVASAPEPAAEAGPPPADETVEASAPEPEPVQPDEPAEPVAVEPRELEADEQLPTFKAVPVGDPEVRRFASGKVIVRHGDNLWSIARRVYGVGSKYTTIYRANRDQIRKPSRIYPGQLLDLPLVYDD